LSGRIQNTAQLPLANQIVGDRAACRGASAVNNILQYDEDMFDRVMAVNVKGVFLGLRHVLPVMLKQGRGAVVNTASVAGLVASPGMPAYVASKHAVIGLTKTAAGEVARSGVRVNAVCPGPIDTRMIHSLEAMLNPGDPGSVATRYQQNIPIGRYGTADEVANLVMFLCSDLASNITGVRGRCDRALDPRVVVEAIDGAISVKRGLNVILDLGGSRDICHDEACVAALLTEDPGGCLARVLVAIDHDDLGAAVGEPDRRGAANPVARAGDQDNLASEIHIFLR
jgi:hypothetical protein